MDGPIQPIFLYADSQLLFLKDGEVPYLDRVRRQLEGESPRAAYVGASNDDRPEFYQLFVSAMETIGVTDCRMIPSAPSPEDLEYFDSADLILLAGGDVERGFKTFEKNGLRQKVIERYYTGALLMGAGAEVILAEARCSSLRRAAWWAVTLRLARARRIVSCGRPGRPRLYFSSAF